MDLLAGIWESLGLEERYMTTALDLHSCFQIFIGNYYPPCPQPELAMGLPPHSDHGLLTILLQNGVDGLQLKQKGNWVNVKPHPNSFLVNTGDHMEVINEIIIPETIFELRSVHIFFIQFTIVLSNDLRVLHEARL